MSLSPAPPDLDVPPGPTHKVRRQGPANPPPVWAETRQELAESLPYYRAYQSGSYTVGPFIKSSDLLRRARKTGPADDPDGQVLKDYVPYAYLLGGYGSRRDAWAAGGRLVVSHGGGHAKISSKGDTKSDDTPAAHSLKLSSSQSRRDPRIAALLSSYKNGTPIILILGENYAHADFQVNCAFAVLGWYAITACWAEMEDDMVRWKVRFQWLQQQGEPWWCPKQDQAVARPLWNPRERIEKVQDEQTEHRSAAERKRGRGKVGKKIASHDRASVLLKQSGKKDKHSAPSTRSLKKALERRLDKRDSR